MTVVRIDDAPESFDADGTDVMVAVALAGDLVLPMIQLERTRWIVDLETAEALVAALTTAVGMARAGGGPALHAIAIPFDATPGEAEDSIRRRRA